MLRWTRTHLTYANVMATFAAVAAVGGGALAIGAVPDSKGRINACYTAKGKKKGQLRLRVSGKKCGKGQKSVTWNQTGPSGSPDTPAAVLAKVKGVDGAGSGLDADRVDGADSSAFTRSQWVVVDGDPTAPAVVRSSGGVTVTRVGADDNGTFNVVFPRDVSGCAYSATISDGTLANAQTYTFEGDITTNLSLNARTITVKTNNPISANDDQPFSLVAIC